VQKDEKFSRGATFFPVKTKTGTQALFEDTLYPMVTEEAELAYS